MPRKRRPLKLEVLAPCNEDWDRMSGSEAIRFCGRCSQNVYNLSAMTESAVEKLMNGPRVCVRFFKRDDGTVVTRQCPPMLQAARRRMVAIVAGLLPVAGAFWGSVAWLRSLIHQPATMGEPLPREEPARVVAPLPQLPAMGLPPPPEPPPPQAPRQLVRTMGRTAPTARGHEQPPQLEKKKNRGR